MTTRAWPLAAAPLLSLLWAAPALAAPAVTPTTPAAAPTTQPSPPASASPPAVAPAPQPSASPPATAPSPAAASPAAPPTEPAPVFTETAVESDVAAPTDAPAESTPAGPPPTEPALPPMRAEPTAEAPPTIGPGEAMPVEPRHRLVYSNALVLRVNPLGVEDRLAIMYRRRLSTLPGKLWEETYFGIGLTPSFAPSISRFGPTVQLVPMAILHLRASYYLIAYYGSQQFKAHPFDSPHDDFSPETIKARGEARQGITTYGGQAELSALFQLKFGPIAVRDEVIFYNNNIKLAGKGDVFYDLRHDLLAPGKGWFLSNDTDIIYVNTKVRVNAGVRATYYHIFYPKGVYEPGDRIDDSNDHARIGPLISYAFKDRPKKRFTKPTLFFMAQWWVKHRYRTGQEISQGLPLMVLGFSFTGELWRRS